MYRAFDIPYCHCRELNCAIEGAPTSSVVCESIAGMISMPLPPPPPPVLPRDRAALSYRDRFDRRGSDDRYKATDGNTMEIGRPRGEIAEKEV
jgi:hypothetical protein